MENLILSMNVVLPLFLMMMLGYFLRRIGMWDKHTMGQMNKISFSVFLPVLLFYNIYQSDVEGVFNSRLIIYAVCSVMVMYALAFGAVMLLEKDNSKRGVLIQGIFRGNFILFGMSMALSIFGEGNLGSTPILYAVVIPMFNVLAVITLEIFQGGKVRVGKTLKGIATNPLIIASLIGLVFLLLRIPVPAALNSVVRDVSRLATPLSLALLGGLFDFSSVKGNLKQLVIGISGRLVVIPAIFMPISIAMGFRGVELVTLLVMFTAPVAVSSFTMAQNAKADSALAGQLVVFGTACSVITNFLWVFVVKQGGYF